MPSYATIIRPKAPARPVGATPAPTSTSYDFSQDALTPQANRMGSTPQQASANLTQQMQDRTIAESRANPGQIAYGAQTGSLMNGQDQVPVTFQAFTRPPAVNINGRQVEQENIPWLLEQQERERRNAEDAARQRAAFSSPMMVDYGDGRGPVQTTPASEATTLPYTGGSSSGAPGFTAPPNQYDSEISRLSRGRTDAEFEADLEAQRAAIESEYRQNLARVEEQGRNKKAARFSDLAGLMVNPLSSGAQSVANSSEAETEDARRYEAQQKDAKIAIARQEIMGKKSEQQRNYLATLIAERDRQDKNANAQYERSFNTWKENNAQALRLAQEARAGKEFTRDEKASNGDYIDKQFQLFGGSAFDNLTDQQKRDLEAAAGRPAGSLDSKSRQTIAEKEKADAFQFVPGGANTNPGYFDKTLGRFVALPEAFRAGTPERAEVGGTLLERDPQTGLWKPVFTAPKSSSSGGGFTLGEGQMRYDDDGNLIASAPKGKGASASRPLTAEQTNLISQGNNLPSIINPLFKDIEDNKALFGPIAGRMSGLDPRNTTAQSLQAKLNTVAQVVGTFLEGGKLAEGDIGRYRTILPQLSDNPDVAKAKLNQVNQLIKEKQRQYIADYGSAGYDVSGFAAPTNQSSQNQSTADLQSLATQNGYSPAEVTGLLNRGLTPDQIKALILKNSGKTSDLNTSQKGSTPVKTSGMRTDRHNNPTAFTTDIARVAGLKEGVDYTVGDPFSGGKYHTAKLIGDPVDTTIKVIDRIGFYTQGGNQRWTHTAIAKPVWDAMNYEQKKAVIKKMYGHEGGKDLKTIFS